MLGTCSNILDLRGLESLFINRLNPVLSSDKTAVPLLTVNTLPLLNALFFCATVHVS